MRHITSGVRTKRGYPRRSTSMAASVLSGIATGHEAAFPNATYLRKRYKKLQKCRVSRDLNTQPTASSPVLSSFDPSFQAIRALNGQQVSEKEPVVVHAIIKDVDTSFPSNMQPLPATPPDEIDHTQIAKEPESFSGRVERLAQAIDRGREIILIPSDEPGVIDVFARDPAASNTNFPGSETSHCGRQRAYTPIISPEQRQDLEDHIRARIEASDNTNQTYQIQAPVRRERPEGVDPRRVHRHGRDGTQCHTISPIPLDYHRPRNIETPVVSDDDFTSNVSSPTRELAKRRFSVANHPIELRRNAESTNAVDGATFWYPDTTPSRIPLPAQMVQPQQVVTNRSEQEEKQAGIASWLRSVKAALTPKKKSVAKKARKAHGVFRDNPPNGSNKRGGPPTTRPDNVLRDMTNIRQPGYLVRNSFAQERLTQECREEKISVPPRLKPNPAGIHSRTLEGPYRQGPLPQTEFNSRPARRNALTSDRTGFAGQLVNDTSSALERRSTTSSEACNLKHPQKSDDIHPAVEFALARLEGRVSPPISSPIQRVADDGSLYGPDVELELGRLRLDHPQPSRRLSDGEWTNRFEERVRRM